MTGPHRWIETHAKPLSDPAALDAVVGGAELVGLGMSVRHAHELLTSAGDILRHLVTGHGFRSVLIEGDGAASERLDAYVRTGAPDPAETLATARPFLRAREVLEIVRWLRGYNEAAPDDPVRIAFGPEPSTADMDTMERQLAEQTLAWQRKTGHRTVYIGGMAHTAVARTRYIPPETTPHRSAGSHLRAHLGEGYRSIGLMFGSGTAQYEFPAPSTEFAESAFRTVRHPVLLDLRTASAPDVRQWLCQPAVTRLIGPRYERAHDADFHMAGESLRTWFDALAYLPAVDSARELL